MDRDENADRNILSRGLSTVGHTGTFALDTSAPFGFAQGETLSAGASNALGETASTLVGEILHEQVVS